MCMKKNKPISRGRKKRILADNHYGTGIFVHPLEPILCERDYKSIINPQGAEFFFFSYREENKCGMGLENVKNWIQTVSPTCETQVNV